MFLHVMGLLGVVSFLQVASSLPKIDSDPKAIIAGFYLLALAIFSGLCFVSGAISGAIDQAARRERDEKAERRVF